MENPHPEHPPAPASEALGEEQALSGSPAVEAVNGALRALSKAARAFTLYEPRNEAIRRFIADFRERMEAALRTCGGTLVLTVQPFELQLGSEPVYAEKDRERSLSFRLFRDGVRTLTFPANAPWEDFLKLLEILSVRFVGVRQQEDDLVTLLTKARFQALTFEAVEGFAEQEDDEEDPEGVEFPEGAAARSLTHVQAPPDFDLPLPPPAGPMVGFTLREVPPRYLEALRAEETPETVPARAVRLVAELVSAAEAGRLEPAELSTVAAEVRDFLVADRRLDALARWVRLLQPQEPGLARALAPLFEPLGRREVLDKLLEAVPQDADAPPATLVDILDRTPGETTLAYLLEHLGTGGEQRVRFFSALITSRARQAPQLLLARLTDAPPEVTLFLLDTLLGVAPQRALEAARKLAGRREPGVQARLISLLEKAPAAEEVSQLLLKAVDSPHETVRIRAIQVLAARHERRAFDVLVHTVQARAGAGLGVAEAEAIGEALARLGPQTARTLFLQWLHPKRNMLRRFVENAPDEGYQWVAVAGLGLLPDAEAEALIKEVGARAEGELKQLCVRTMLKRRRGGKPHG